MSHARLQAWSTRIGKKFDGASAVAVLGDSPGYLVVVGRDLDATEMRQLENSLRSLGVHTWHWQMEDGRTKVRAYVHGGSKRRLMALVMWGAAIAYFACAPSARNDVLAFAQAFGLWARQRWGLRSVQVQEKPVPGGD